MWVFQKQYDSVTMRDICDIWRDMLEIIISCFTLSNVFFIQNIIIITLYDENKSNQESLSYVLLLVLPKRGNAQL